MKDTTFYLTEQQLPRLATSYLRTGKGELEATDNRILYGKPATSRDRFPAANGGLFSTAADYARFCQMILNAGEIGGKGRVKPESVKLMTTIQTGDLVTGFTPGNGWGLGWCVIRSLRGSRPCFPPARSVTAAIRHPGMDRPREKADLPPDGSAGKLPQLGCFRSPSRVSGVGYIRAGKARWEKEIRAFEREDLASRPPEGAIVFIGSSSTRLWKTLARDFPEHKVINRGFGGSQIADVVSNADRVVIPYKPKLVVLQAGSNDLSAARRRSGAYWPISRRSWQRFAPVAGGPDRLPFDQPCACPLGAG